MIPRAHITEWRANAPWSQDAWVEQDLVICRALVEIFSVEALAETLAFRGGTALHKLYLRPAARYSEDIDLVQVRPEPIGETLDLLREALDPWLGEPKRKLKKGRVNLVYRFDSESVSKVPLRLKIEINMREHFSELGLVTKEYRVGSRWFRGTTNVTTFELEELLGTKLRALYQRKKGRDLFDLALALNEKSVDPSLLLRCFARYMSEGGHAVTRARFEENLHHKAEDRAFRGDIDQLLRPDVRWVFDDALDKVREELVRKLPGEAWRGE